MPTIAAIAVAAYALCDLVHEVLGHGVAALLVPGIHIVSLSSVALQTTGHSRLVAAAGSIANLVAGLVALGIFHRRDRFSATGYFLWLFGSLNLMNGAGYPLYSAVLGFGDWEIVIRGLEQASLWRVALGVLGAVGYVAVVRLSARELTRAVMWNILSSAEIARLVFPAYILGGALLVVAAAFNQIDPKLVFLSGVSSGFAAMAGLTVVPAMVEKRTAAIGAGDGLVWPSPGWIATGLVVGFVFVAIVGPGVRF